MLNRNLNGLFNLIIKAHTDRQMERRNLLYKALTKEEAELFHDYIWKHNIPIEGAFMELDEMPYTFTLDDKPNLPEVNPVFTFWIDNKIVNERKYFASDVRQIFQKWLLKQDRDMVTGYPEVTIVGVFIGDKNGGLSAVQDSKQMYPLLNILLPDIRNYISGINPVTREPMSQTN